MILNSMNDNFAIQLFEGKKVRIVWDAEQEKYYFSVVDIVQVGVRYVPRDKLSPGRNAHIYRKEKANVSL